MLKSLELFNFRNFTEAEFDLSASVTVFTGKNGSGKSSVLEAVYLFSTLRSFRTNALNELRKNGTPYYNLKLLQERPGGWDSTYKICGFPGGRNLFVDDQPVHKASQFAGSFRVVGFFPDDFQLMDGGPAYRRHFFDRFLCMTNPDYYTALQNYQTAVKSYNALLHSGNSDGRLYSAFAQVMIKEAAGIIPERVRISRIFSEKITQILAEIKPELKNFDLKYDTDEKLTDPQYYADKLDNSFENDKIRGSVRIGPHHDDFVFSANQLSLRNFGSRGQCRITALALKLAEYDLLTSTVPEKPVVIVDDAFSDLDIPAKKAFLSRIFGAGQLFCAFTELPLNHEFDSAVQYKLGE